MIRTVKKHSGYEERFSLSKLERSVRSALRHADIDGERLGSRIAHEAREYLEGKGAGSMVGSGEIEEAVLHVLRDEGMAKTAQAYELVSLHLPETALKRVVKRGGGTEPFHPHKLFKSIKKSFGDAGIPSGKLAEELAKKTVAILEAEHGDKPVPAQDIKRTVAHLLAERGLNQVERMYVTHKYL